jgi:protein-tyrosine-phosphatase/DNA-binding HxlR family transcriptional regulator
MDLAERAQTYAALGDERRLAIVDHLGMGDRTVAELGEMSGMRGNLLAHHLDVLESAGLIARHVSEGDQRRRYVSLRWEQLPASPPLAQLPENILFVCTHNSARSQFAAALWEQATGRPAESAGSEPAKTVNPKAVRIAGEFGIDLSSAEPRGYDSLSGTLDLVVSVCDRAREFGVPAAREQVHWSVPDPVARGTIAAFRDSFRQIARRVDHLTARVSIYGA